MARSERHLTSHVLPPVLALVLLGVALTYLHRELADISFAAVVREIGSISWLRTLAALAFTAAGYAAATGYDLAGMRYIGASLPVRQVSLTSFIAYAVGNNIGLAALSGGSVRYRMYSLQGLTAPEIARVILFNAVTFWVGAALLVGIALLVMPDLSTSVLDASRLPLHVAGALLLAVPVVYAAASVLRRAPIQLGTWQLTVPPPRLALVQLVLSAADLIFAGATLYVLLAPQLSIGFLPFLGIYLIALAAGVVSTIPGGLGVFEAVIIAAIPGVAAAPLLGTIMMYRVIYFLLPFVTALSLLVIHEMHVRRRLVQRVVETSAARLSSVAPQIIGLGVFIAGVALLVSGAIPVGTEKLRFVSELVPLPVLELSHLTGSAIGAGLLLLSRGLFRRLRGAYVVTAAALLTGIAGSLLKGLDFDAALFLGVILLVLWAGRDEFYRVGTLTSQPFTARWNAALLLGLACALWFGLVSYRHIPYSNELWWRFAVDDEAPRALRAILVAVLTVAGFALWKLTKGGFGGRPLIESQDMNEVRRVVTEATSTHANLALLGDKRFLWSTGRDAFIMYQVSGTSWIAMGDPVGPQSAYRELLWDFRELVDRHDGSPVFYQASHELLPLYVDMGLALSKLGENARVSLPDFSLEGSQRAELRQAVNRGTREGAQFEVVPRERVPAILESLRAVSDAWIESKRAGEKGFSLGSFTDDYIRNFDCAVVTIDGSVVAFANLWPAPAGGELAVDLMRFDQRAPRAIMDFLFTQTMLWGKAQGYHWFSLGMAPLAGLATQDLAPVWHKVGHLVFMHGEAFYNFEGLRNYKEKFHPEWEPRYLASRTGLLQLPKALFDVARLISGGVKHIVAA